MFLEPQDLAQRGGEVSALEWAADMSGVQDDFVEQVGHAGRINGENGVDGIGRDRLQRAVSQKQSAIEQDLDLARVHIVAHEAHGVVLDEILNWSLQGRIARKKRLRWARGCPHWRRCRLG